MMKWKRIVSVAVCVCMAGMLITGCGSKSDSSSKKRIIRVALSQSEEHPEYKGMETFKKYVEEKLGDKYEVQLYPNELLGGQTKAIELTQTGAIDFTIAGTPNLEIFADVYEVFSMPYLFTSEDAYFAAMNDTDYMNKIYASTEDTGLQVVTWYNVGTRNFYAKKAINTPDDLKGLKMRVQQSKLTTVKALQSMGYETIASGDSYNDLGMIKASKAGFLFCSTEQIKADNPDVKAVESYAELMAEIKKVMGIK